MELREYLNILWHRKWVVILTFAITMIVIAIGTQLQSPVYEASTTLRIATSAGGPVSYSEYMYSDRLLNTYVEIATSEPVLAELAKRLGMSHPPAVTAELILNTELIKITVEDTNAKQAAMTANTLADILIDQSNQLYTGGGKTSQEVLGEQLGKAQANLDQARKEYEILIIQTPAAPDKITLSNQLLQEKQRTYETLLRQYEEAQYIESIAANMITVVETAVVPNTPSQPRVALNYTIGALLGILGGMLLAFIFENMDNRLHNSAAIETAAHTPILAKLPRTNKQHLILSQNGSSPFAESVRHLAAQIQWMDQQHPRRVMLLAGSETGQGASTAAANLALALAEQGKNVAIVDYNLRHPHLHELFGLPNEQGLTDVLTDGMELNNAIQKSSDGRLSVLTSGPMPAAQSLAIDSTRAEKLIAALRQKFEYILLDAPALTVADAASLAPYTDGLILVVRRHARREAVESAGKFMSRFEGKFMGLIVNEAQGQAVQSYV